MPPPSFSSSLLSDEKGFTQLPGGGTLNDSWRLHTYWKIFGPQTKKKVDSQQEVMDLLSFPRLPHDCEFHYLLGWSVQNLGVRHWAEHAITLQTTSLCQALENLSWISKTKTKQESWGFTGAAIQLANDLQKEQEVRRISVNYTIKTQSRIKPNRHDANIWWLELPALDLNPQLLMQS